MDIEYYLSSTQSKYAVLRYDSYLQDPIAQQLTPSPRTFEFDGVTMAVISLEPLGVPALIEYINTLGSGVEFELTIGSGKVTLLLHNQILAILDEAAE